MVARPGKTETLIYSSLTCTQYMSYLLVDFIWNSYNNCLLMDFCIFSFTSVFIHWDLLESWFLFPFIYINIFVVCWYSLSCIDYKLILTLCLYAFISLYVCLCVCGVCMFASVYEGVWTCPCVCGDLTKMTLGAFYCSLPYFFVIGSFTDPGAAHFPDRLAASKPQQPVALLFTIQHWFALTFSQVLRISNSAPHSCVCTPSAHPWSWFRLNLPNSWNEL